MPRIMKTLNNISRSQAVFRRARLDFELAPSYHTYILAICRAPGRTQDELAADICTSKSTVARRVDWLLEHGYITRVPSEEDKRCLLVYPTEKMLEILPRVRKITDEWNFIITEGISDEELSVFKSVLSRMEKKAKAALNGGEKEEI